MRAPWEDLWRIRAVYDPMTAMAGAGLGMQVFGTLTQAGAQSGSAAAQRAQAQAQEVVGHMQADIAQYRGRTAADFDFYKADLSDFNAKLDEQRAQRIETEGSAQADIVARASARGLGKIQAAFGAAGVTSDSGSVLAVMHDAAAEGELQKQLTLYGAKVGAQDQRTQGKLDTVQAGIYRAMATNDLNVGNQEAAMAIAGATIGANATRSAAGASDLAAGTTLLTGLGRAAAGAYNFFGSNGPPKPSGPGNGFTASWGSGGLDDASTTMAY